MFVRLGCHLAESDAIGHDLFRPGESVYQEVVKAFGTEILLADQTIDRKILGDIVFHDPSLRLKLNSLVHPEIIRRQKVWLDQIEASDPQAIGIVESALMIEVGTYRNYDKLIVVVCSAEEQIRRLQHRSGLSEEEASARIQSQIPIQEKVKFADYVIDTSGAFDDTARQVEVINSKLRKLTTSTSNKPHRGS
jgi:dephospho-CoA kinase